MTHEQLFLLALAAIDEADARPVLADAIEQVSWDTCEHGALVLAVLHDTWPPTHEAGWDAREWFAMGARLGDTTTGDRFRRAIAAVMLLGEWPEAWPLTWWCRRRRSPRLSDSER